MSAEHGAQMTCNVYFSCAWCAIPADGAWSVQRVNDTAGGVL
jgi:hypothetical protein